MKSLSAIFVTVVGNEAMSWDSIPSHLPFAATYNGKTIPQGYYVITSLERNNNNHPTDWVMHDPHTGVEYKYSSWNEEMCWVFDCKINAAELQAVPESKKCICFVSPLPDCPEHGSV